MLKATRFAIQVIHPRIGRYLKRQEKRIQRKFWDALDQICEGPFHCSYRYALSKGKRGLRIKYDVDVEAREITVYDFGPRGDAYQA
jgi:mRNA-degrading endonuclease RelE of RelBE toxin-antitoxin system